MRVLITRPAQDAAETARQLVLEGHDGLIASLLDIVFFDGPEVMLDGVQAILATSANGVRAMARRTSRRAVPVFAVGPQTQAEALAQGFADVRNADGDAQNLALAVMGWADPARGALLHAAGEGNDGKLAQNLPGFTVQQEILYAVRAVAEMPADAASALRAKALDAALFYSPRSAAVFRDQVIRQQLPVDPLTAICISAATAAALAPLSFRQMRVAAKPNQENLFKLLF